MNGIVNMRSILMDLQATAHITLADVHAHIGLSLALGKLVRILTFRFK